ncbi:zinc ribbon domain-containing protein [Nonomuraea muscovyensis]|uniref:zinc ribbon domain-containing protein n=1 Tax=Nonomuraea muscovyensis TaxID=1124761 RepID=UPI0028A5927D|nr:zinc ribbon domain-containing protein [Nonomuraea muscovyensis]
MNPANTSRTCSRCGHCPKENRVTQAGFRCTACGHTAHADVNAAVNILGAGPALRDAARAAWREAAPFRSGGVTPGKNAPLSTSAAAVS